MSNSNDSRIIKRYGNRKLYDTELSRYVTIEEVAGHIRNGISVTIVDNKTGEDITSTTLAQIVMDAEKKNRQKGTSSILESVIKTGTLTDFLYTSSGNLKSGIEEAEKWFSQLVDSNKVFWADVKAHIRKHRDSAKFEEFGEKMEEYFSSTIEKVRYNTNRDRVKTERELIGLRQRILELEAKIKKMEEEEKRRISDE